MIEKYFKLHGIISDHFVKASVLLLLFNSCSVVRTPYTSSGYYKQTVDRLDNIRIDPSDKNDSLYAGFARVSITPALNIQNENPADGVFYKIPLAGFGQRRGKPAAGIHDSIFVKAIALRTGDQLVVLVGADLLLIPPNIVDSVTALLSLKGLDRTRVFYSATHSHSSLGAWGYGLIAKQISGKENKSLEKWLTSKIYLAVICALSDLHPAIIGSGTFDASLYTRNRLMGEAGIKNNDFSFIKIEQTGGRKAIIGSFSAHATTLGDKNMELSGDYPGYWEQYMERGAADLAMFCGGSMGSQSYVGSGEGFGSSKFIGESLGDSTLAHLHNFKMNRNVNISSISLKIQLPEYHLRLTTHINLTTGLSKRLMPFPVNVYLQALKINDLIWVFTPGDFSGESAVNIKDSLSLKGYNAIVSGYNGSYVGYILPGKYFYLNNYETKLMGWFGPTMGDYIGDLINRMCNLIIKAPE